MGQLSVRQQEMIVMLLTLPETRGRSLESLEAGPSGEPAAAANN